MLFNIYALRVTADDEIRALTSVDSDERASAAFRCGLARIFAAIPYLWGVIRFDPDPRVCDAASNALAYLIPTAILESRYKAGLLDLPGDDPEAFCARLIEAAESVLDLLGPRWAKRHGPDEPCPGEFEKRKGVCEFLLTFSVVNDAQLDERALAAFAIVGTFARHLEILPEEAGMKGQSWKDTLERLEEYDGQYGLNASTVT